MKLFLLNSRENKKSRKIGFTILGFFYNFIHISKALLDRKRKTMNTLGPKSAQVGPTTAETRPRARARGNFAQRPSVY
jgi:hypothetical protein